MKIEWFLMVVIVACVASGCSTKTNEVSSAHEEAEGEEKGPSLSIDATHDSVRRGVRLVLEYDEGSSSFVGTVKNVTTRAIKAVRVEVHLSNGTELGPTPRKTLKPGETRDVTLSATGQTFETWKAHAESGEGGEHGHGSEGEGEHGDREKRGEHGESGEHR